MRRMYFLAGLVVFFCFVAATALTSGFGLLGDNEDPQSPQVARDQTQAIGTQGLPTAGTALSGAASSPIVPAESAIDNDDLAAAITGAAPATPGESTVTTSGAVVDAEPKAVSNSSTKIPVFDTAWEMPTFATDAEIDAYLDHIAAKGFTGFWISQLSHIDDRNRAYGEIDYSGTNFTVKSPRVDRVKSILRKAEARNLEVGLVVAWGVYYINADLGAGSCNNGILNRNNSNSLGVQAGKEYKDFAALKYFVMGGDNFCSGNAAEDEQIWANLVSGIRSTGAKQVVTYHSNANGDNAAGFRKFGASSWNQQLAIQTGHCRTGAESQAAFNSLKSFGKPVIAAELRYFETRPGFCKTGAQANGAPVTAAQVAEDAQAALNAGVTMIMYGDWDRWSWCAGGTGRASGGRTSGCGGAKIAATFNTPGEDAFFKVLNK